MNIFAQIALGNNLAKLTSIMEIINATDPSMPTGDGGGLDRVYPGGRARASADVQRMGKALRKHPRHVITRELCKNMILASQLGRTARVEAQESLFTLLIEQGIALPADEFNRSYA